MDWHKIDITAEEVKTILHIGSLTQSGELAKDMQDFCQTKGLTFTLGDKSFAELLS